MSEMKDNLITLGTTLENEYNIMRGLRDDDYDEQLDSYDRPKQHIEQRVRERKQIKLTPEREAMMIKSYESVCVNDFGDDYHMSDEEKEKRSELYKVFKKMRICKTKYRKIDEYVRAYRTAIECIEAVSKQNKIYGSDDFIAKILKGKIKMVGLKIPKYIGKDKRYINWDIVAEYIANPSLNEKDLIRSKGGDTFTVYTDEDFEKEKEIMFGGKIEELYKPVIDIEFELYGFDEHDEEVGDRNICTPIKRKYIKELHKTCPVIVDRFKQSIKEAKMKSSIDSYDFNMADMQYDDIEQIKEQDVKRGYKSKYLPPVFKGDASKKDDVNRFLYECDEYNYTKVKRNYHGTMMTAEEYDEQQLKEELDRAGWNVRNMYKYKSDEKKMRKQYKIDVKKEKKLKERLVAISKRNKEREKYLDVDKNSVNKKKKKKSKKVKKHDKKMNKKFNDELFERTGMEFEDYEKELFGYNLD